MSAELSFECPSGFSHVRQTTPSQLLFSNTHSHLLAQPQLSNTSLQFTTWATVMMNLSLSKLSEHPLFLSQNMAQKWVGVTAFKPNACQQD